MLNSGVVAVFTPEIAIDQELHTYSGGLGVVSGGFLKSAYKLGMPMVGITILPRQGYFDQCIHNGRMGICHVNRYYDDILEEADLFKKEICSSPMWMKIFRLSEQRYQTSPVLFIDTDIDKNDLLSRSNTLQLYGGSRDSGANVERKIVQSLVLSRGGLEALKRLDISVNIYHLNESHTAFVALDIFASVYRENKNFDEAVEYTRSRVVFTTHTPVRAGNPEYDLEMVMRLGDYQDTLGREVLAKIGGDPFNMTVACLRLSGKANAVSQKHLGIAKELWHWVDNGAPLIAITNGVCRDYWQYSEFGSAVNQKELEEVKRNFKRKLLQYVKEQTGKFLGEHVFTVTWARRFAEYKRPKLLFYDLEWISSLLRSNSIQIIISGKPHPDDYAMVDVFNDLLHLSRELPNMVVLPGYELELSKMLKAGSDLWLNTPRSPNEASGTSGMSAQMNGALHMTTPDGWACEADPENCFLFGSRYPISNQDAFDVDELGERMNEAITMYYSSKEEWYQKAMRAKIEAEQRWTSDRMLKEYINLLYNHK